MKINRIHYIEEKDLKSICGEEKSAFTENTWDNVSCLKCLQTFESNVMRCFETLFITYEEASAAIIKARQEVNANLFRH